MTATTAQVETQLLLAFGEFRGEVRATLQGLKGTSDSTWSMLQGMDARQRITEGDVATLKSDMSSVKSDISALQGSHGVPVNDFNELKDEVKSNRLSWGKVSVLVGALAALSALFLFIDRVIPG